MRALTVLFGGLTAPLLLLACSGDASPITAPATAPTMTLTAGRGGALDPTHTYRFAFDCSSAASDATVTVTAASTFILLCDSSTEQGLAVGSGAFSEFQYEVSLGSPTGKACSAAGVAATGTFRCRHQKYAATLTVTDEGPGFP